MSHESSAILSDLHFLSDNLLLLGVIPAFIVLFLVYRKFGEDSRGIGREGIFEKLEHKVVKIGVTAGVAALILGVAHVYGVV
jgi:hypothetical protein